MVTALLSDLLAVLAFGVVGLVLLVLGYGVINLLTPGNLGRLVFIEHNRDASYLLASAFGAIGLVVATAIWTSGSDFATGLLATALYGVAGLILLGLSYVVVDAVTPGNLGEILTDDKNDPAVAVTVVANLTIGLIVAASLT